MLETWVIDLETYKDGKLNSEGDNPAVVYNDGTMIWYKNGYMHRDGDKPAFINSNGSKAWWKNGNLHREVGPAVIDDRGKCSYYVNGCRIFPESDTLDESLYKLSIDENS